ncbi:MAG TPA: hydrogenase maturation protease [Steroidobacteraceae bacterium]|nr:hydrogenase maturation protease [Steroidobacteraceae bacterium]
MTPRAVAPVLVIAVGNPSRGDDAIGPELAARLEAAALPGVEVLVDFQLQVEHAVDLLGREQVLFVDAGTDTPAPFELSPVQPAAEYLHTSHALPPAAVLAASLQVHHQAPPPARLLCVRGEHFELGAPLSAAASAHLEAAWAALLAACTAR